MLRQEVNLYKTFEVRNPAANFLTWNRLFLGVLLVSVIFTLFYFFSSLRLKHLIVTNENLHREAQQLEAAFAAQKKQFPPLFFTSDVGMSIDSLQKELNEQKKLLQSLALTTAFSQDLIAFATNIVPNVWLTNIAITNSGARITLKGKSRDMTTLQTFISKITTEPLFSSFIFNVDNILKTQAAVKDGDDLSFELSMSKQT